MMNEGLIEKSVVTCNLKRLQKLTNNVKDINFRVRRTRGLTLLHIAAGICEPESKDVVAHLLQCNADPNLKSDDGLTPTHIATIWNNYYALPELLTAGGNPFLKDEGDQDALDMALENEADECYELLSSVEYDKRNTQFFDTTMFQTANEYSPSATRLNETSFYKSPPRPSKLYEVNSLYKSSPSVMVIEKPYSSKRHFSSKGFNFKEMKKWVESANSYRMSDNSLNSMEELCTSSPNNNTKSIRFNRKAMDTIIIDETVLPNSTLQSTVTISDTDDETVYSDDREGIVLVERRSDSHGDGIFTAEASNGCDSLPSDWKSFRTTYASLSSVDSTVSERTKIEIPDDLVELGNMEIFAQLQIFGDNPGPVFDSTRELYLRRLAKLKSGVAAANPLPSLKYPPEIYSFLKDQLDLKKIRALEQEVAEEFDCGAMSGMATYREGNQRCSFNYFLLDPRVTRNLPMRAFTLTTKETFNIFLDALFYVGKGTKDRPYSHLYEAAKAVKTDNPVKVSNKVAHILDIWQSGAGVISLHCFHSSIPVEAFTREACIIDAIGVDNLTNIKKGNFYGKSSRWTMSKKRQLGVLLLSRALEIFLLDGERVIRPKDVK